MKFIKTYEGYADYQIGEYISLSKSRLGNGIFNCLQIVGKSQPGNGLTVEYIVHADRKDILYKNEIYVLTGLKKLNPKDSYFAQSLIEEYELRKSMTQYNL